MRLLADTNFLIACVKKRMLDELKESFSEILVPNGVIDELTKISKEGGASDRISAELALKLISLLKIRVLHDFGYVDEQIINYSKKEGIVVATLDKKLQKVLQGRAKLLILRGRKFIVE